MEAGQANPEPAARRHIIERPRLTRLLTEAEAPIVLLVAPPATARQLSHDNGLLISHMLGIHRRPLPQTLPNSPGGLLRALQR
jgi:hypothetical protein